MTSVWIITETTVVVYGQESQDCEYSTKVLEVFSSLEMANATKDFLNHKSLTLDVQTRPSYSVTEYPVSTSILPVVKVFLANSRDKEALHAQLAAHWKSIKDIENKLRGCDA